MSFHTLGDSHCHNPWEKIPGIKSHHYGAILAHTIGKHKHDLVNGVNIGRDGLKAGDIACFCFGEIDCRCHVSKFVNASTPYQKVIDEIVNNEIIALAGQEKVVPGVRIMMNLVVPPPRQVGTRFDPLYPFIGSDNDRLNFVCYFNEMLIRHCKERGWGYVDVYIKYADGEGFLNHAYSDGHVHVTDPRFYVEFLHAHGLL
jgi:hypothetical protein